MLNQITSKTEFIFNNSKLLEYKTDSFGKITTVNSNFEDVIGFNKKDLFGKHHSFLRHSDMPITIINKIYENINNGISCFSIIKNITKKDECYWTLSLFEVTFKENSFAPTYTVKKICLPKEAHEFFISFYKKLKKIELNAGIEIAQKYLDGFLEYKNMKNIKELILKTYQLNSRELLSIFKYNHKLIKNRSTLIKDNIKEIDILFRQINNLGNLLS